MKHDEITRKLIARARFPLFEDDAKKVIDLAVQNARKGALEEIAALKAEVERLHNAATGALYAWADDETEVSPALTDAMQELSKALFDH